MIIVQVSSGYANRHLKQHQGDKWSPIDLALEHGPSIQKDQLKEFNSFLTVSIKFKELVIVILYVHIIWYKPTYNVKF